jgi:hypothetical protein
MRTPNCSICDSRYASHAACSYNLYRDQSGSSGAILNLPITHSSVFSDYDFAQRNQSNTETSALLITVIMYAALLVMCHRRLRSVENLLLATMEVSKTSQKMSLTTDDCVVPSQSQSNAVGAQRLSPLELGQRELQILKIKKIRRRVFSVCVICMVSMCFRAAYNLCKSRCHPA